MNSDSSGLPSDIGTDQTARLGEPVASNSNRWGRAGEETPGGVAILEDGSINTERFSEGPDTELEVSWWNKRMLWQVRREPTGHRVVVARVVENIWRVHIMVAGAITVLAVFGMVIIGGLPLLYAAVLGVVMALIGYGALAWERRAGDENAGIEEIIEMDSVMWVGVRNKVRSEYIAFTEEGQKRSYKEAVAHARTLYERKYADPATGKVGKTYAADGKVLPVKKFVVPKQITDEFLDKRTRLGPDTVVDKIKGHLVPARLEGHRRTLLTRYRREPKLVEAMGRGVLRCECAACVVQAELGIVPERSGAEASRRRAAAAAAAKQADARPADPATRLDQLRQAAGHLRGTDRQSSEPGVSADVARAREALAKTEETSRRREQDEAAQEEKGLERERRDASRARVSGRAKETTGQNEGGIADRPIKNKKGKAAVLTVAGVVSVIVVALVAAIVLSGRSDETEVPTILLPESSRPSSAPTTTQPSPSTPAALPTNGEVVGVAVPAGPEDPGSQKGGAAVIAAYDYAYYVKRSGAEAVAMYAPGARPDAGLAQNAIDANPEGTRYQLAITPVVVGKEYDVVLKVMWPGLPETEARQKFFTTYSDGKYFLLRQAS